MLYSVSKVAQTHILKLFLNFSIFRKARAKMPSRQQMCKRDWGRGMATAGRTKTNTSIAKGHFGPIPGIDVGMSWQYRIQVSEVGVHAPPVAGISGTKEKGCNSLVLAGGYEDDIDYGDEFSYTGKFLTASLEKYYKVQTKNS